MKKMLKTGKKTLSVIMAVLMVMTAWVWVAPTKAEAVAGTYDVQIKWYVDSDGDMNGNGGSISLITAANNGTGSETKNGEKSFVNADTKNVNSWNTTSLIWTGVGFPTKFTMSISNTTLPRTFSATVYVYVRKAGTSSWSDAVGSYHIDEWSDNTTHENVEFEISNSPTPTTYTWTPSELSAMTVPKGSAKATQTVKVVALDQFGVQMYDPIWSVKGNVQSTGISVTSTTVKSESTTITLTNAANIDTVNVNSQTGTVTAKWGNVSKTKTFNITDSKYDITFSYKTQESDFVPKDVINEQSVFHGDSLTIPSVAEKYADGDYDYKFIEWKPEVVTKVTNDEDYVADYDEENRKFIQADYTAVDNIKAEVQLEKDTLGLAKFNAKYTLKTLAALETAVSNSLVDYPLGRTKQNVVDGYAVAIEQAFRALEPNKFDVIFLDGNGAIIVYEKGVEFESNVTPPEFPEDQKSYFDATNHYTYSGWDTDEYTSVIDDLVISPVYAAEAHDFETETVTSTCVQAGTTKHTCKTCGYTYYDGGDQLGDHVWEDDFTVDLEPTCVLAGSKSIHCTLCDAQKDITAIAPLGHQWGSQSVAVEATCGKIGIMSKVCDDCGVCEHTIIPALVHDYAENTVAPTCTTKGYTEYVCQRADCGYSYRDNYTDIVAHTYGAWETVSEAHCGVEGVKKQTCTECGYVNIGSIDALAHDALDSLEWVEVIAPTCEGKGYQTKTCSKCLSVIASEEISATGHSETTETKEATCTQAGYTKVICSTCGKTDTTIIQPLGHNWTSTEHEATCTSSAYIEHICENDSAHSYIEYVEGSPVALHTWTETDRKAADCENDGYIKYECSVCKTATKEEILPKLGHSYGNWEVVEEATNSEDGQWKRVCANNAEHIEYLTIPKGGHTWGEGSQTLAPTCTTTGTMVYACTTHTDCGTTLEVTVPVAQHTVAQKVTEATCTKEGSVEAYCSVCGTSFEIKTTPVKAHNFVAQTPAVAPTCTTSGYTVYKCSDCDFTYNVYDESKSATGHTYNEAITAPADCTNEGEKTYTCACGASYTAPISPTGHSFVEDQAAATDATCTALATKTYKCTCGESYTEHYGTLAAHNFDTLVKTVPATNDSLGYEERKCDCGLTEITILEATGTHVFGEKIENECVAPTCTENGTDVYKCTAHTDCGAKSSVLVPRLGHTAKAVYNAPTCIAQGSSEAYCTTCKTTLATEIIPVIGYHDFSGEGVKVDATCTNTGTMTYTCQTDGCDATKTETIPAKGHDLTTEVIDAKCGEKGKVVITCSRCDDPAVEKTYELAAKNHSWNNGEETVAPTCTTDGTMTYTCTACGGTKTETIPAKGHEWGEWVKTDATTTADGAWTRTCSVCSETETLVIPMGHNLVKDTVNSKAATCLAEGKEVYKCNNHDNCGITLTVTLDKLQHTVAQREIEATCKAEGKVEAYCTVCNTVLSTEAIPVKAHNYVAGEEVEPTCTTSGYTVYKCDGCNDTYNEINGDALGHKFTEKVYSTASCTAEGVLTLKCADCDVTMTTDVPALGHDYQKISTTVATCAAAATETYKCSRCDAQYTISVGEKAKEHSYSDNWTTVQEATPTSIGYRTRTCSICGQLDVDTIEATGEHKFETGEIVNTVPATCTENGYVERKCSVHTGENDCGKTANITIPATGHTEEAIAAVAATCEKEGSSAGSKCSVCGTMLVAPVTLPALGHNWGNEKVTPATCQTEGKIEYTCTRDCGATETRVIAIDENAHNLVTTVEQATCTAEGKVIVSCQNGDCTFSEVTATIPAKGHTFTGVETPVKDASCTENGEKAVKCANCDEVNTVIIPKLGHKMMAEEKVDPTCTTSGYTPYTCANGCGESYRVYDETVKEHNYVQVEGSSTATCIAGGTVTMKCSHCDDKITAAVPALGHSYGEWTTVNPTAEVEGSKTRKCDRCDATETVILPKLGHDMVKDEAASTAATCTEKGKDVYVCTTHTGDAACGYTYSVELPAKGHSYDEGTVKAGDEATCDKDGVKTFTCACGDEYTQVIPMTGHKLSTTVTEATCKDAGSVVTECTNSGCDHKVEKVLAKLPHTISVSYAYPGCDKDGYVKEKCDKCDYENIISTVPALGHSYTGEETVTKEATCLEKGEKTVKCSRCDASVTVEIPAKGHSYVAGAEVPATCTESGYIPYECACGSSYKELVSNPNGHKWNTQPEAGSVIATCVVDGKVTYKCQFCDAKNEVITPKFGHSWSAWEVVINPTATVDGVQMRKCLRGCGATESVIIPALGGTTTYTVSFVVDGKTVATQTVNHGSAATAPEISNKAPDAKYHYSFIWDTDFTKVTSDLTVTAVFTPAAHDFGEWVIDLEANCNRDGARHRVCSCGYTESEVIPATEHDFSEIKEEKAATCTENGYKVVVCKNCGATERQTIKRLGHLMNYFEGVEATCDRDGVAAHYSCSRCGKSFEDRAGKVELTDTVIKKRYHTYVVVEGSDPTCTKEGVTDYRYCTACGYTQHPEKIPATGHADVNNDNTCDKCGATYMQGGEVVCSCRCHKNGFFNELIYKILSFFWRLFGTNKSCECGKVHY